MSTHILYRRLGALALSGLLLFSLSGCRGTASTEKSAVLTVAAGNDTYTAERLAQGCALLGVGSPVGLHSAAFCPDSSVLLPAARFLAESAWSVLEEARA